MRTPVISLHVVLSVIVFAPPDTPDMAWRRDVRDGAYTILVFFSSRNSAGKRRVNARTKRALLDYQEGFY